MVPNGVFRGATTGVLKGLTWSQHRLLSYNAQATHFLNLLIVVRNDPVTTDNLGRLLSIVGNPYGIGKTY